MLEMGFAPGPLIGKILAAVEAQLNSELTTKEAAISFMSKFWQKRSD